MEEPTKWESFEVARLVGNKFFFIAAPYANKEHSSKGGAPQYLYSQAISVQRLLLAVLHNKHHRWLCKPISLPFHR
jgi:hypothetical protein